MSVPHCLKSAVAAARMHRRSGRRPTASRFGTEPLILFHASSLTTAFSLEHFTQDCTLRFKVVALPLRAHQLRVSSPSSTVFAVSTNNDNARSAT